MYVYVRMYVFVYNFALPAIAFFACVATHLRLQLLAGCRATTALIYISCCCYYFCWVITTAVTIFQQQSKHHPAKTFVLSQFSGDNGEHLSATAWCRRGMVGKHINFSLLTVYYYFFFNGRHCNFHQWAVGASEIKTNDMYSNKVRCLSNYVCLHSHLWALTHTYYTCIFYNVVWLYLHMCLAHYFLHMLCNVATFNLLIKYGWGNMHAQLFHYFFFTSTLVSML